MLKVKIRDKVKIKISIGIPLNNVTIGKSYEVVDHRDNTPFIKDDEGDLIGLGNERCAFLGGGSWIQVPGNRDVLKDFIKLNQIKTTLVSKYLGHSPSWLTTMANEKRRGDLSDESLKAILKKLHIDWSSNEFINVKATKEHTAYRTRPCTYTTEMHKERLQRAMWGGEFVK